MKTPLLNIIGGINLKKISAIIFVIILTLSVFTSCKVEFPDEVADDTSYYIEESVQKTSSVDNSEDNSLDTQSKVNNLRLPESSDSSESKPEVSDTKPEEPESKPEQNVSSVPQEKQPVNNSETEKPAESNTSKTQQQLAEEANKSQKSGNDSEKDRYMTDPIPEGMPEPKEWQDVTINKGKIKYCTLSIDCLTILDNMDDFNNDKISVLPEDGIVFAERKVIFYEGESVFDVLNREMKKNRIHMEFVMTPIYNSNYIEGINNLYEFDCGELSGWMYEVNGWYPNYGCSRYQLKDGDVIKWRYTCDLGRDLGCVWNGD